jgi:uncharacterized protein YajQ (UPF0234 family)
MPSFDISSEFSPQELKNAVENTARILMTRFDFKNTDSKVELKGDSEIEIESETEDRLRAVRQVLEEQIVHRKISLKFFKFLTVEDATKGRSRQKVKVSRGIDAEHAKAIGKIIKDMGLKTVSSSVNGDHVRVTGKKRDDLQAVIAKLKNSDFDIALEFGNFRD